MFYSSIYCVRWVISGWGNLCSLGGTTRGRENYLLFPPLSMNMGAGERERNNSLDPAPTLEPFRTSPCYYPPATYCRRYVPQLTVVQLGASGQRWVIGGMWATLLWAAHHRMCRPLCR